MKIGKLDLQTSDLAAQRHFYMEVLQLPTIASHEALFAQVGSSQLTFRASQDGREHAYHFAFNIPENRFDRAKEWIAQRLPLITSSTGEDSFHFDNWNAHACYFRDPAGNILEFIARHDLTNASDLPFDERSILYISEIGVATDDVKNTVDLLQGMGIPIYDGEGSDTFTAVGDEHGLIIVVKRGRVWFPDTGTPAGIHPLRAVVSVDSGRTAILSGPPYQFSTSN